MLVEAGGRRYTLEDKAADAATFLSVFKTADLENALQIETARLHERVANSASGRDVSRQREKVARLELRVDKEKLRGGHKS